MAKKKKKGLKAKIKGKGLTIQFIPHSEISDLKSGQRVKKIIDLILGHRIIILQGRLKTEEEVRLIEDTMALVGHLKNFKGVELAVIQPETKNASFFTRAKEAAAKALSGIESAITIIGPASIVKEMKKDPKKIELMLGK